MRIDIKGIVFAVRSSFWFIPALMAAGALVLALLVVEADFGIRQSGSFFMPAISIPVESARLALSTIAGSMITVATLVFSMTLVALTMVSRQLGPRVLLRFMDDRETQAVLGIFIATFLFALIVLMRAGDEAVAGKVPGISVFVTAGLTIVAMGMMIRFIHHIATRIQADILIAELGADLIRAARKFVRLAQKGDEGGNENINDMMDRFEHNSVVIVTLPSSGYLSRIQSVNACELAVKHKLVMMMKARPGNFVLAGTPVLAVLPEKDGDALDEKLEKELRLLLAVDERRTPEASVEFEIKALVEVALRALSPGVNDPYTAVACIDRLGDGLRTLMERDREQRVTRDEGGKIRIIHAEEPFARYVSIAFEPICNSARSEMIALEEMHRIIGDLESLAKSDGQRKALQGQKSRISDAMKNYRSGADPI